MAGASGRALAMEMDNSEGIVQNLPASRPGPTVAVEAPHQGLVAGRLDLLAPHQRGSLKRKGHGEPTFVKPRPSKPLNKLIRGHWPKGTQELQRSDKEITEGKIYTDLEVGVLVGLADHPELVPDEFHHHIQKAVDNTAKMHRLQEEKKAQKGKAAQLLFVPPQRAVRTHVNKANTDVGVGLLDAAARLRLSKDIEPLTSQRLLLVRRHFAWKRVRFEFTLVNTYFPPSTCGTSGT